MIEHETYMRIKGPQATLTDDILKFVAILWGRYTRFLRFGYAANTRIQCSRTYNFCCIDVCGCFKQECSYFKMITLRHTSVANLLLLCSTNKQHWALLYMWVWNLTRSQQGWTTYLTLRETDHGVVCVVLVIKTGDAYSSNYHKNKTQLTCVLPVKLIYLGFDGFIVSWLWLWICLYMVAGMACTSQRLQMVHIPK